MQQEHTQRGEETKREREGDRGEACLAVAFYCFHFFSFPFAFYYFFASYFVAARIVVVLMTVDEGKKQSRGQGEAQRVGSRTE